MEPFFMGPGRDAVRYWWVYLVAGLLLIGIGVWVFSYPIDAYLSLSLLFAVGIVANGAMEIVFAIANARALDGWGWMLAAGILDLAIGWYLLIYPALTMTVLPFIIGFWVLFRGFSALGMAFDMRRYEGNDWLWLLFASLVLIVFAGLILANPAFGVSNIIIWTASAYIVAGVFRVMSSIKLYRLRE